MELCLAAAAAVGFVLWELRTDAPMLNPRLFAGARLRLLGRGRGWSMARRCSARPTSRRSSCRPIQGYTATRAGLLLMPAGLAMVLVFPIAGRIADRVPPCGPIGIGLVLFGAVLPG